MQQATAASLVSVAEPQRISVAEVPWTYVSPEEKVVPLGNFVELLQALFNAEPPSDSKSFATLMSRYSVNDVVLNAVLYVPGNRLFLEAERKSNGEFRHPLNHMGSIQGSVDIMLDDDDIVISVTNPVLLGFEAVTYVRWWESADLSIDPGHCEFTRQRCEDVDSFTARIEGGATKRLFIALQAIEQVEDNNFLPS